MILTSILAFSCDLRIRTGTTLISVLVFNNIISIAKNVHVFVIALTVEDDNLIKLKKCLCLLSTGIRVDGFYE